MGRNHTNILRESQAAEVVPQGTSDLPALTTKTRESQAGQVLSWVNSNAADLTDKTRHLAAIHAHGGE